LFHVPESYAGAPDTCAAQSAYGEGKRAAELLCILSGLDAKIARCFAFVGPGLPLDQHFAVGNFLRNVLNGEPIRISGDGRPWRSYLYAADLTAWLWTILFRGTPGRMYNVGSEQALTISETAGYVSKLVAAPPPVLIAGKASEGPAPRYVPCTARARLELGLWERISLSGALQRTFDWHIEASRRLNGLFSE
jgi:dTDP-glucose 4,6-dehydratase